ncbi:hypothetical protein ACJ73_09676 [Blastomyces percursus]|uniref:Uncharacterized protein n=1 Tax=Blastomyces percursus TaxID=1658174 RepID=A0A1J9PSL4_9EURO|nr:hypothetical protein ACJ73_09676 [Blastomyces percursus]
MPKPLYKEGFLTICTNAEHNTPPAKATVVTFIYGKVRIVQATCNPSEAHPTLNLMLRAIYSLGRDNYDKKVALMF